MTYLTHIIKVLLFVSVFFIGCGAPQETDVYNNASASDTTYTSIDTIMSSAQAQSDTINTIVTPTVIPTVISERHKIVKIEHEMPKLEIQQTSNEYIKPTLDTLQFNLNAHNDNDSTEIHKKNCYKFQTNKVKKINDTISSIDEKFKKIEEKIKRYKK